MAPRTFGRPRPVRPRAGRDERFAMHSRPQRPWAARHSGWRQSADEPRSSDRGVNADADGIPSSISIFAASTWKPGKCIFFSASALRNLSNATWASPAEFIRHAGARGPTAHGADVQASDLLGCHLGIGLPAALSRISTMDQGWPTRIVDRYFATSCRRREMQGRRQYACRCAR